MIEANEIFSDSDKRIALWCDDVQDTNDLAIMCENIVENGIDLISVPPSKVQDAWVYLEKKPVKILTRYDFVSNHKDIDNDIANLAGAISNVCKHGAGGVQIFIKMSMFEDFCDKISPVSADLFFGKNLCVVMDILDVDVNNWNTIFEKLRSIGTNTLAFTLSEDIGGRSDFVGRIYGMLENYDFDGELHFLLDNNYDRIDQVIRLIETVKPELNDRVRFFLNY